MSERRLDPLPNFITSFLPAEESVREVTVRCVEGIHARHIKKHFPKFAHKSIRTNKKNGNKQHMDWNGER